MTITFKKQNIFSVAIICLVILSVYALLYHQSPVEVARLKAMDFFYGITRPLKPFSRGMSQMVVIAIDDESLQKMEKKWPWDRSIFAAFLNRLIQYKPRVIGMDIAFVGEGRTKKEDRALAASLKAGGNIILGAYFNEKGELIKPHSRFLEAVLDYGFVNKPKDADLLVRRMRPAKFLSEKELAYSFDTKIVAHYLSAKMPEYEPAGRILRIRGESQEITLPVLSDGTTHINYSPMERWNVLPFWTVLNAEISPETIKDKLVLIGMTGEIFHDMHNTPIGVIPGVFLHANSIAMMLGREYVLPVPAGITGILLVLMTLFTGFLTYRKGMMSGLIYISGEILALGILASLVSLLNFYSDFFGPFILIVTVYLAITLHQYITLIIETGELRKLALTDELTGLFTYRYFLITLSNEIEKAIRYTSNLSLIIFDVDHFKNINDTYGHDQGNVVLRHISRVLQNTHRKVDGLSRYGGDEFCIILPHTGEKGAFNFANRLKEAVEKIEFQVKEESFKITLSVGIADLKKSRASSLQKLFECADQALYDAKKSGRNRICAYDPES